MPRYVGNPVQSDGEVTDGVFAATNPRPYAYVPADGSLYDTDQYPALLNTLYPVFPYRVAVPSTTWPNGGSNGVLATLYTGRQLGDAAGTLVMLGVDGSYAPQAYSSTDGLNWSQVALPTVANLKTGAGTSATLNGGTSPDIFWDPVSSTYVALFGIQWTDGFGHPYTSALLYSSPSLASPTWTFVGTVAAGESAISIDGEQGHSGSIVGNGTAVVLQACGQGLYRCPATSAANVLPNWTSVTVAGSGWGFNVKTVNGSFVATDHRGNGPTNYYTSTDGATWTAQSTPNSYAAADLAYVASSGKYVLLVTYASGGAAGVYYSSSIAGPWTAAAPPAGGSWGVGQPYGLAYLVGDGSAVAVFMASSGGAGTDGYSASIDGVNWTPRIAPPGPTPSSPYSGAFMANGTLFCWANSGSSYLALISKTPYAFNVPNWASPGNGLNAFFKVR